MKYILLLTITTLLLTIMGCGGGGSDPIIPPGSNDLSGLSGTWTVNLSYTGTLVTPTGNEAVADSGTGTWLIARNGIAAGFALDYTYNGNTLVVHWISSSTTDDPECGSTTITADVQLQINIQSGATSANITGSGTMARTTENCGDSSGTLVYTGSMVKS